VTVFEHIMLGASTALAAGLQPRYGWRIVAMAGAAGALPDWDGLSLLAGSEAYARVHRVWGHNLLTAGVGGLAVAFAEYRFAFLTRLARAVSGQIPGLKLPAGTLTMTKFHYSFGSMVVWLAAGLMAGYSHLLADFFYSGHPSMRTWGLPLLWPFSEETWARPTVAWGDLGATLIFIASMFALYRWPRRGQPIGWLTLTAVSAYVGARFMLAHPA
jgi:hypothetical protein